MKLSSILIGLFYEQLAEYHACVCLCLYIHVRLCQRSETLISACRRTSLSASALHPTVAHLRLISVCATCLCRSMKLLLIIIVISAHRRLVHVRDHPHHQKPVGWHHCFHLHSCLMDRFPCNNRINNKTQFCISSSWWCNINAYSAHPDHRLTWIYGKGKRERKNGIENRWGEKGKEKEGAKGGREVRGRIREGR